MQAVKSIREAKAVTEEKIVTKERIVKDFILTKAKKYVSSILFGDINSINTDSEKIRNYHNYDRVKSAERASAIKLQTFFR